MEDHTTKRCTKCGKEYPATTEYFHKQKRMKSGLNPACKACRSVRRKRHYAENREMVLAQQRRHRTEHPEKTKEQKRRWAQNNSETNRANAIRYYKNNTDRMRENNRRYQQRHPDKVQARDHRRRALEVNAEGTFTDSEIQQLYADQKGLCFHCCCELSETGYHIGHWIPLSRGGSNWISNIRLLCPTDNLSQGNKLPWEWCPEKYSKP